jgi:hypothetical protein
MLLSKEIKMPRTIFIYVFLISLLIASCSPSSTPEPLKTPTPEAQSSTLPALGGEWTIKMNHSGGIMGLSRSIEISSDGKFAVVDERADKTITGELSADELSKINEQLITAEYIPTTKPDGMGCADCFIYDLEIRGSGEKFAIQLNDISLPNSGLESLVTHLRGLIETTLK